MMIQIPIPLRITRIPASRTPASGRSAFFVSSRSTSTSTSTSISTSASKPTSAVGKNHRGRHPDRSCEDRPHLNLSLFGPPGSGKGSYGKHFARALNIPLVTTSDVLRKLRPDLAARMSDGKLVDDVVVGETLLEGLMDLRSSSNNNNSSSSNNNNNNNISNGCGYILDGFPRTLKQVALMEDTWPESLRIRSVVHLEVPDFVCEAKLLGRRACSKCGKSYNVHGVDRDGWKMPPHLPLEGRVCEASLAASASSSSSSASSSVSEKHAAGCDWSVRREDDTPEIVGERLRVYHKNADPILDCIRNDGVGRYRVLTLKPYNGFDDIPGLVEKLYRHVGEREE